MIACDRIVEPFLTGNNSFAHGYTFGGHPVSAAVAMANLDIFEREDLTSTCGQRGSVPATLEKLSTSRSSATSEATATSTASSWSRTRPPGDVQRRRVRAAAARLPVQGTLRRRALLPRRRPGRPRGPAVAAADLRPVAFRRDGADPARGAHRGLDRGCKERAAQRRTAGCRSGTTACRPTTSARARRCRVTCDVRRGHRRRRLHRTVDGLLPRRSAPRSARRGARDGDRRVRRVRPQRRLVLRAVPDVAGQLAAVGRGARSAMQRAMHAHRRRGRPGRRRGGHRRHWGKGGTVVVARTPVQLERASGVAEARRWGFGDRGPDAARRRRGTTRCAATRRARRHLHPALRRDPPGTAGARPGPRGRATRCRDLTRHAGAVDPRPVWSRPRAAACGRRTSCGRPRATPAAAGPRPARSRPSTR